ncbi:MAG: alpha-glucosidase [Caulobacter sp.]|nr:alpha-glucosidase [Caulobacter sp.]
MRRLTLGLALAAACIAGQAGAATPDAGRRECVDSPSHVITVCLIVDADGPAYEVSRKGKAVIARSALGLVLKGDGAARVDRIAGVDRVRRDDSWEQPWGEQRVIRDHHSELRVALAGPAGARPYSVVIRAFDDGFAFRYDEQAIPAGQSVAVLDERTEFNFVGQWDAWWYPARQADRDEYLYHRSGLNEVGLAETPFTLQGEGLYLSIHEAALVDYSSMNLKRTGQNAFKADLMPWSDGVLVKRVGAFQTPWRTVQIGETAGQLADSRMILNLNEPSQIKDIGQWFTPAKYVGIWWEMHLNKSTWGSGPTHGANNDNVRKYIDFAAANGFSGVLVEGWNQGWDGDWIANGAHFSFTKSYPDFDLPALAAYAKSKGVKLIGHNETAGALENYESQLEDAMALYEANGVSVVKTGYVKPNGSIVRTGEDGKPANEWFAGQYAVRHNLKVAQAAARHHIAIDAHEPVKDTGLRRTWPNMVSREGARGQEFNAWGRPTNPPEHLSILPFTRLLAGPMDFTPGIFDLTYKDKVEERVQSTLAVQLAEYVVIYSPVHMAADLPENYAKRPDAFQFIKDVPTDWETSHTLAGEIGDYVVVARQQRGAADWYLGAITDENARIVTVKLDFLARGKRYEAQIYRDGPGADYRTAPYPLVIEKKIVTARDSLTLAMAPGGGQAIRFKALD